MRRYRVRHLTEYVYEDDVTASYGWAYLTPLSEPGQRRLASRLEIAPSGGHLAASVDYFGNPATYFEVHRPHRTLVVTATSDVLVDRVVPDLAALDRWTCAEAASAALGASEPGGVEPGEFLLPSPRLPAAVPVDPRLLRLAEDCLPPGRPLGSALRDLVGTIHRRFRFRAGATTVGSTLGDLLDAGEGVCQDLAHLAVAVLRERGLPARYVSGYLETLPPPGQPKLVGADASHAWVSVWTPTLGWVDLDPTNDAVVGPDHVVTARGRDYSDVPPLKGVIFTEGAGSGLRVAVDVTRLPAV